MSEEQQDLRWRVEAAIARQDLIDALRVGDRLSAEAAAERLPAEVVLGIRKQFGLIT
jgi:hypothetical protein